MIINKRVAIQEQGQNALKENFAASNINSNNVGNKIILPPIQKMTLNSGSQTVPINLNNSYDPRSRPTMVDTWS
jgi:hypothetical protein